MTGSQALVKHIAVSSVLFNGVHLKLDRSKALFDEAKDVVAGGASSPVRRDSPFPLYTKTAIGSHVTDMDDNVYVDCCMGNGALLTGHASPVVAEAIRSQLAKGWLFSTPSELEIKYAKKIKSCYPSMELVRMASSRSEAVLGAVRAARAFTGKSKAIVMEGGYGGWLEQSSGLAVKVPFNDSKALEEAAMKNSDVACIVLEPVMTEPGVILPKDWYLRIARNIASDTGIVLIFDETSTGFRINMFGAQGYYGVGPDMTVLGKVAGGGLPIGVFGGRKDIMDTLAPLESAGVEGTFNAHPLSLAAGLATIEFLDRERAWSRINANTKDMWQALTDIVRAARKNYTICGVASMFQVFIGPQPENYGDALKCDMEIYRKFRSLLLEGGVLLPPTQLATCYLSYAHTKEDFDKIVFAFSSALERM